MKFEIPAALRAEHEELHAQLVKATRERGAVGETALARGPVRAEMAAVLPMTRKLKAELPAMLAEHRQIVLALDRLRAAAKTAGRPEYERFARALVQHAETEERVLYPAVILLGEHLERTLKKEAVTPDVA